MRLSIVIPSPVFFFFFFERSRELEIPPSLGNVFFKKPKKNWRNLSLHSLQLLNHLKEFLFPPFFSLSRDIVAQVEREGKGGEMFCPSAATAAYPRWCTEYQIQQTLGLDQRETVLTCTRIVTGRARRFKRCIGRSKERRAAPLGCLESQPAGLLLFLPFLFPPSFSHRIDGRVDQRERETIALSLPCCRSIHPSRGKFHAYHPAR